MSPEAQRIAIAEACPNLFWVHESNAGLRKWRRVFRLGDHPAEGDDECDPTEDLNAMHEAETAEGMHYDQKWIESIVEVALRNEGFAIHNTDGWDWVALVARLSAAQRAEAFLRTIGKWEESK